MLKLTAVSVVMVSSVVLAFLSITLQHTVLHYDTRHWLIHSITADELVLQGQSAVILDARSPADYASSHIDKALSFPAENLESEMGVFLDAWSPEKPVIIFCGGQACGLSKQVAIKLLTDLPEAKIFVLKGGFPAWLGLQAKKTPTAL